MTLRSNFAPLDYWVSWRAHGARPGSHQSRRAGEGDEFRAFSPFSEAGDVRRLDLRATARDPLERLMVRRFRQRSAVPVYLLADLSASMTFEGRCRKLDLLAEFLGSLAFSAYKMGDPFGFVGCGSEISREWLVPLGHARGHALDVAERLTQFTRGSEDSASLLEAASHMSTRRSLVFLVSDFHLPLDLIDQVLATLSHHQVVPVILRDSAEERIPTRFGLMWLRDLESGGVRFLVMRAGLRSRLERARFDRALALRALLLRWNLRPLIIEDRFRPEEVRSYFRA